MSEAMHNARILQSAEGKLGLFWDDDAGKVVDGGDFDSPDEAAAELARLQAEAAAPKADADAT
jgi:hypothetical protein